MTASDINERPSADVEEIKRHVIGLFDAYLSGDREALRDGRVPEWKGFQIRSERLVRGVDEYMDELDKVMSGLVVDSYEFLDFEVDIFDDLAVVYYVARDFLRPGSYLEAPDTVLIRSVDIYRRVDGSWIQAGSNICSVPDTDAT